MMSEEGPTQNLPNNDLKLILTRLNSIDSRLDGIDSRLNGMDVRLEKLETHAYETNARLEKLEARAYDTKPIWERALIELIELGKQMDNLDRRFSVLNDDVLHARADYRKLEERIAHIEQPRA